MGVWAGPKKKGSGSQSLSHSEKFLGQKRERRLRHKRVKTCANVDAQSFS